MRLSQLLELLNRPGARKAAANLGWLVAEKLGRLLLGVVVGLWVARYLGPVRLGTLSYCLAVVTLLGVVPALGLDAIVKRELLRRPEATSAILAAAVWMRLLVGAGLYLLVLLAAWAGWGLSGDEPRLLAIVGLLLLQPAFYTPDLWLQAQLRGSSSFRVQLLGLLAAAALRIALVVSGASLAGFAWAAVLEVALCGAGLYATVRRSGLAVPPVSRARAEMQPLLAASWPLLLAGMAAMVYLKIDEVMLRLLVGPGALGIYSAAVKLSEVWYFFPVLLASSVLPALLRARERDEAEYRHQFQRYYDASVAAAYAVSVPIALGAPWLVRMAYGESFAEAAPILTVHIWSSVFIFLDVARGQWLVNERLQRFYLVSTVMGAVANVLLNVFFIPRWQGLGAAYATVISYALAGWLSSFAYGPVRAAGRMQTRALLLPVLAWRGLRTR